MSSNSAYAARAMRNTAPTAQKAISTTNTCHLRPVVMAGDFTLQDYSHAERSSVSTVTRSYSVPSNETSSGCRVATKGLATVTPLHVNPDCRSSESSKRHPAAAAAAMMIESHMLNW